MKASLYILEHIVDDFGNCIPVHTLKQEAYLNRYNYFYGV